MNFQKNLQLGRGIDFNLVPVINVFLLLVMVFLLAGVFSGSVRMSVTLPKAVTSDILQQNNIIIVVTRENILYLHDRVMTLQEVESLLMKKAERDRPILIKADRGASIGRIVEVWNLARKLGIDRISITTEQGSI